jgi:hypothetical protein
MGTNLGAEGILGGCEGLASLVKLNTNHYRSVQKSPLAFRHTPRQEAPPANVIIFFFFSVSYLAYNFSIPD